MNILNIDKIFVQEMSKFSPLNTVSNCFERYFIKNKHIKLKTFLAHLVFTLYLQSRENTCYMKQIAKNFILY